MPGRLGYTMLDYSREKKGFGLATGNVTAASLPGLLTEVGALRTAVETITLGVVSDESLSVFNTNLSNTPPANALAQIESDWLVVYEDVLPFFDDPVNAIPNEGFGRLFTLTIPTADIATRLLPASDEANPADAGIIAFKAAFEAVARSPYGGTTKVRSMTFVGRNR